MKWSTRSLSAALAKPHHAYMRRLRVVDLATSWRAFGGRPWDLSIRRAYSDREQASRTPVMWVDAFRSSRSGSDFMLTSITVWSSTTSAQSMHLLYLSWLRVQVKWGRNLEAKHSSGTELNPWQSLMLTTWLLCSPLTVGVDFEPRHMPPIIEKCLWFHQLLTPFAHQIVWLPYNICDKSMPVPLTPAWCLCGAWWLSGKFGALHSKSRRFESTYSHHVGTLGKSCTHSSL